MVYHHFSQGGSAVMWSVATPHLVQIFRLWNVYLAVPFSYEPRPSKIRRQQTPRTAMDRWFSSSAAVSKAGTASAEQPLTAFGPYANWHSQREQMQLSREDLHKNTERYKKKNNLSLTLYHHYTTRNILRMGLKSRNMLMLSIFSNVK
jgi:hypothetical protein